MAPTSDVQISHHAAEQRWEAHVDGELAGFAAYIPAEGMVVFSHTEVDPAFEGKGVGSSLARAALDDARTRGDVRVMPLCPFINSWMHRHKEYDDLRFNAPASTATD